MSLVLKQVEKSYQQGGTKIHVLKGLTQTIEDGEIVAIVGQSGSGKSTLLSLLSGLDRPDSGEIQIAGKNIVHLSENDMTEFRAKNIGIIFQQFHLMPHLTALENVMVPLEIRGEKDAREQALQILQEVGLSHRTDHLPSELSGGECQRVAIARAMVAHPQFILADEPSGNLDPETGEMVMNLFLQTVRKQKITTILVTHSMDLAKKCDRVLVLRNGVL